MVSVCVIHSISFCYSFNCFVLVCKRRARCSIRSLSLFILFHFYYVCCTRVYGGQYQVNLVSFFSFQFFFLSSLGGKSFTAPALSSQAQQHREIYTNACFRQITIVYGKMAKEEEERRRRLVPNIYASLHHVQYCISMCVSVYYAMVSWERCFFFSSSLLRSCTA